MHIFTGKFKSSAAAVIVMVSLFTTVGVAAAKTPSSDQLQDDIQYVRQYTYEYRYTLGVIERDYQGCYRIDEAGLTALDTLIQQAQTALYRGRLDEAASKLQEWEKAWQRYDLTVTLTLDQCDYAWLKKEVATNDGFVGQVDAWIQGLKDAGYDLAPLDAEWGLPETTGQLSLRSRFFALADNPPKEPGKIHEELDTLLYDYTHWSAKVEAKVLAYDHDAYDAWVEALGEWLKQAQAYFDAESADINRAMQDGLLGAKDDSTFLESKRKLFADAQKAFDDKRYEVTDANLNQLDRELFQPWTAKAQETRKHFDTIQGEYARAISTIETRMEALSRRGVDVHDVFGVAYNELTTALPEADDAAARYCSTYFDCDALDEYDGYWAATRYTHVYSWLQWFEQGLQDYEATGDTTIQEPPAFDLVPADSEETPETPEGDGGNAQ